MKHVKVGEVKGFRTSKPYERIMKLLFCPEWQSSKSVSVGVTVLPAGNSSRPHSHEVAEEVFYVLSGKGEVKAGEEVVDIETDVAIIFPPGEEHQIVNTSNEELKILWMLSLPEPVYRDSLSIRKLNGVPKLAS